MYPTEKDSRQQKRLDHKRYALVWGLPEALDSGLAQLRQTQVSDQKLEIVRKKHQMSVLLSSLEKVSSTGAGAHPKLCESMDQLILHSIYREMTRQMVHLAPWDGHFGKRRTSGRILFIFIWPGVHRNVAVMCRRCQTCQWAAQSTNHKVTLMPPAVPA